MTELLVPNPERDPRLEEDPEVTNEEIVAVLTSYKQEALNARRSGQSERDSVWSRNVDLYWGRFDWSQKADWQSKQALPEAPMFVDRWAATMREALVRAGQWYTVKLHGDKEGDLSPAIQKFINFWLSRCAHNATGHPITFEARFEEQMKLAAMMACCAVVTWRTQPSGFGYVSIETEDPRAVALDATGRNMYRVRSRQLDLHAVLSLAEAVDETGEPLYDTQELAKLIAGVAEQVAQDREQLTGQQQQGGGNTSRQTIDIDEYLCDIVMPDGRIIGENVLAVVANDKFLIRGLEPNPFWHERDWIVFAPALVVPLSVYGRTYMENWSATAETFVHLTNLLLDATFTSSMKVFAIVPDMLEDPTEADEGIHPNKMFSLAQGRAADFIEAVDLGEFPNQVIQVWTGLKQELREGAAFNEIAMGQLAPVGDKTATEITETLQSSSALIRSIARTVETWMLEPLIRLVWLTALQHFDPNDPELRAAVGGQFVDLLAARREEFARHALIVEVKAISGLVQRAEKLRNLLSMLQVVAQNDLLLAEFLKVMTPAQLLKELFRLYGLDTLAERSEREQLMSQVASAGQPQQGQQQQRAAGPDPAVLASKREQAQAGTAVAREKAQQARLKTAEQRGKTVATIAEAAAKLREGNQRSSEGSGS